VSDKNVHHSINYIELPSTDLEATKTFYGGAFGWTFQAWGDTYLSFSGAEIKGGFELDSPKRKPSTDGALVILYSDDLEASVKAVTAAGGGISVPPFDFPGGRRFHFHDPSGNELAIWTPA
jgi:predicted enzyme related to lactoylglutathione lyase